MCINCPWSKLLSKAKDMMTKPAYVDRMQEISGFIEKINVSHHVTPDDIKYINEIIEVSKPLKTKSHKINSTSEKVGFDPMEILMVNTDLIQNFKYVSDDGFYAWNEKGVWNKLHEDYVTKHLSNYIPKNKVNYLNELFKFFQLAVLIEKENGMNNNRYMINMKNLMLDLSTGNTVPHDKSFLSTVQIPVDFDPNAVCPKWEAFIKDIISDPNSESILQEFVGYCMVPEVKFEKCLILVGTGANGKTTFTNVISEIIGLDNISHVSMPNLSDKNSRANLLNKLVNIASELEVGEVAETDYFKKIISGEPIDARFLFKDFFTFKPFCRLIFSMNNLPHMRDKSFGLFRRLIIVEFPKTFENNPNRNLSKELLAERSGIFNWALKGLQRLYNNEKFSISEKSDKERKKYQVINNSVMAYCEDNIDVVPDSTTLFRVYIEKLLVYDSYKNWALDHGLKPVSCITMYRDMKNIYRERICDGTETNKEHRRKNVIYGVQFKP